MAIKNLTRKLFSVAFTAGAGSSAITCGIYECSQGNSKIGVPLTCGGLYGILQSYLNSREIYKENKEQK